MPPSSALPAKTAAKTITKGIKKAVSGELIAAETLEVELTETADLEALTRRFYDEVANQGNLDLIDEMLHHDFVEHEEMPGVPATKEGTRKRPKKSWARNDWVSRATHSVGPSPGS